VAVDELQEKWAQAAASLDLTVRFAETDLMGVVHHSAYVIWFEAGRVAWMAAAGMPYTEVAAMGHHFAVTGVQVEYRAAARFGDVVRVVTRLSKVRSRQVSFAYEVRHSIRDELLAVGSTEHICVDLDGRMAKIPQIVAVRLVAGVEQLAASQV
jgi:acyl-CoA thioester hydrolase